MADRHRGYATDSLNAMDAPSAAHRASSHRAADCRSLPAQPGPRLLSTEVCHESAPYAFPPRPHPLSTDRCLLATRRVAQGALDSGRQASTQELDRGSDGIPTHGARCQQVARIRRRPQHGSARRSLDAHRVHCPGTCAGIRMQRRRSRDRAPPCSAALVGLHGERGAILRDVRGRRARPREASFDLALQPFGPRRARKWQIAAVCDSRALRSSRPGRNADRRLATGLRGARPDV